MLMRARVKNRLELFELLNKNHACVTQTDNAEKWGARRAPRQPRCSPCGACEVDVTGGIWRLSNVQPAEEHAHLAFAWAQFSPT